MCLCREGISAGCGKMDSFFPAIQLFLVFSMNVKTVEASPKKNFSAKLGLFLAVLCILILTGCARPNNQDVRGLLSEVYKCKWLEVESYRRLEAIPGLWSYVIRYRFHLDVLHGDEGARQFIQSVYNTTPGVTDWQKLFENPKAHAFLRDDCDPAGQRILQQIIIHTYIQLNDKTIDMVEIPRSVVIVGWAEMTLGRTGWMMDMRRDKVDPQFILTEPIPKSELIGRARAAPRRGARSAG